MNKTVTTPDSFIDYDLVIFDCDGVLVDSEMLSAKTLMDMMAEEGLPITVEMFRTDFLGRSFANAAERAELRFNKKLPEDFQIRYRHKLFSEMQLHLKAMPGVDQVLKRLNKPFCLATSSSPQRLALSLSVCELTSHFSGRVTTASEVKAGKPAPDIFLLAAERMGIAPARCLVIEDSEMGVLAAQAAGMSVWHFAGGAHIKAGYKLPKEISVSHVVEDMFALLRLFQASGICAEHGVGNPAATEGQKRGT